jgi:hypothetical protein
MIRLKNRNVQIPNGLGFYLPATGWSPRKGSSFQGVADSLFVHLQANPAVVAKLGWKLDRNEIADRVDQFNAQVCEANGWTDYIYTVAAGGQPGRPFQWGFAIVRPPKLAARRCCGG